MDRFLLETQHRAGKFVLEHILGVGQYSVVRQCVDVGYNDRDHWTKAKDAIISRKLFQNSKYTSAAMYDNVAKREGQVLSSDIQMRQTQGGLNHSNPEADENIGNNPTTQLRILAQTKLPIDDNEKKSENMKTQMSGTFASGYDKLGRNTRLAIKIINKSQMTSIDATLRIEREIAALTVSLMFTS